jgi:hypothetical protein
MKRFLRNLFRSGRSSERKHTKAFPRRQSFILEPIESRLLLSADLVGVPTELPASLSAVSQFVHEQLAAPDHGGIGAQVSGFAQAQHSPNQNGDPHGSAVSQFVHELLAAPDHGGIGAQVSAFAQAQHSPNDDPHGSAVSQFVHELLAAPDHGGIDEQVSAFAQAQHSTANQADGTSQPTANIAGSEVQNGDPHGSAVSRFVHELLAAPDHGGIGEQVSAFAQAQHSTANQADGTSQPTANIAGSEVQNGDPHGSAVSQFVHEQLAAPDHGEIGAQVSGFAQAQHSPNQNGDPHGSAVSRFVHELLAAPDHGGIGAQVSAFAQAQHSPNQNGDPHGSAVSQFVHELLAAPDHGGIGAQVSAFAQAQHSTANQTDGADENETDADSVLPAGSPNQQPVDQAPLIASSVRSISTADGFSNVNGDLVTHIVFSPPDNGIAIGGPNGYIISVVNDTIGWTPDLSETPMQFEAFSQFFPTSLVGKMDFTDPQVLYDADHGHFIVTEELFKANSKQSNILIAVSHDANPNDGWDFFSINSQYSFNGKLTAADYPQSDTDGVNLFITSDQFSGSSNYFGSVVTVIPLSSIENGAAGSISYSQFVPNTPIKETLDVVGYHEKGAFFVGYDGFSQAGDEFVTIGYYNGSTGQERPFPTVDVGDIDNLGVNPLVATQPNGHLLDANDRRITDVKIIGNDLFAVTEVVPNSPNSVPNVHWFDFDVTNPLTPVLKAQGDLPGTLVGAGAGVTTFNGSITGDSKYLVLNFTATGPSLNPSDYFAISIDAGQSWEIHQYATSPTSYSDGSKISRWGDYSSAVVDPTHNHAFLISNEYAVDASHWGTKISDFKLA